VILGPWQAPGVAKGMERGLDLHKHV
jgi:hypothetical protein